MNKREAQEEAFMVEAIGSFGWLEGRVPGGQLKRMNEGPSRNHPSYSIFHQ